MKSVKSLQAAADQERNRAEAERKNASKHRSIANSFSMSDDTHLPLAETDQAQRADAAAQQHMDNADRLAREASVAEKEVVKLEGQKQKLQEATQAQVDKFDQRIRALRGE